MSHYYRSLDAVAQKRYLEKLKLLNLTEKDDPYLKDNEPNFLDDMTRWPQVEYGHFFCYYIERPGVYTRWQLMNWKSLEAYNYFKSGHVRTVRIWPLENCCIMMANVNPSQNSPDKAHTGWAGLRYTGEIITVHCNCMAGLGEGCSHSAAVLFKVEAAIRSGYTSVTSNLCGWNQIFSDKHEPVEVIEINFSKPKRDCISSKSSKDSGKRITEPTEEQSEFLNSLQQLTPDAAILSACHKDYVHAPQSPSASVSFSSIPPTILSLYRPRYKGLSSKELLDESKRVFKEELMITDEESVFLFQSTQLQAQSLLWHEHRRGRLTASRFGAICKTSIEKPSESLVKEIICGDTVPETAAIQWGRKNESTALTAYIKASNPNHEYSLQVLKSGLFVNPLAPHIGASADGQVSCKCCSIGVLEIKCPYSIREKPPTCAPYIVKVDDRLQLSRKHNYYYQVQGQMCVFDYSYCDFVCWTPVDIYIERINYDEEFVCMMMPKLDTFFLNAILPKVLSGKYFDDSQNESSSQDMDIDHDKDEIICLCRKGESGKMIECDNIDCEIGWYHYHCLNIPLSFEPTEEEDWFCPDCEKRQCHI